MKYRNWTISRISPPIPTIIKWQYVHEDYDGPEDNRCSVACTLWECIVEINEREGVPYSDESLLANARLMLLTDQLEKLERQRVKDTEHVAWLNAKAWIEAKRITPDDIWTKEEVWEIAGFGVHHSTYERFAFAIQSCRDQRKFVQVDNNMVYELASIRDGSWIEMNVSIYQVEQYAKEFATKPDTNPA